MSLIDGAFAICTAFDAAGIEAVLCGGSAASYYAPEAYMSADDDFVLIGGVSRSEISAIMLPLGFRESGRIYIADGVAWSADFPPGPLAVGRDVISRWNTVRRGSEILHVVTALDAVRDRFMHYLAWDDYSGLTQAVAVAKAQRENIDFAAFRAWTDAELRETRVYDARRVKEFFRELRR
jgi:hypothetical protein